MSALDWHPGIPPSIRWPRGQTLHGLVSLREPSPAITRGTALRYSTFYCGLCNRVVCKERAIINIGRFAWLHTIAHYASLGVVLYPHSIIIIPCRKDMRHQPKTHY
ncbi:hypothetical protein THICB1_200031 [Thiomonas arsenitoxydans]|uniref:Uncharacterized protein n=1 Tax=Thiomonas arsenitoxydans (strain DSM 22701 / CIP 110005 / 3As) TaxID=426114 RepID=A0ABP1Z6C2_THIA3|nr:hypothetical protein THICB1_200031 [Thiomonas arsenitoxydans]